MFDLSFQGLMAVLVGSHLIRLRHGAEGVACSAE